MKHLKKVLLMLTLLALIVSSVSVVALAEEAYQGSIEEAEKLLAAVDAPVVTNTDTGATREKTTIEKYTALIAVYQYVSTNNLSLAPKYDEFALKLNAKAAENLALLTKSVFGGWSSQSYYAYIVALEAAKAFDQLPKIEYPNVQFGVYTGDVAVPAEMLKGLNDETPYQTVLATLAEVYAYLLATPVNPMTDAYLDFITEYNNRVEQVAKEFEEAVDSAITPDEKLEILLAVRPVLAGVSDDPETEEIDETKAPAPISANLVSTFNAVLEKVVREHDELKDTVGNIASLEDVSAPGLVTDLTYFKETHLAKLKEEVELLIYGFNPYCFGPVAEAAAKYLAENNIDPAAEGYNEAIEDYHAAIDTFSAGWKIDLDSIKTMQLKFRYMELSWYSYLHSVPYSENAVKRYNEAHDELVAICQNFIDQIESYTFPEYVVPEEKPATATTASLIYALGDVSAARAKYNNATPENKPVALEEWKAAMAAMYRYIDIAYIDADSDNDSVLDSDFIVFKDNYNIEKAELISALLATVDAAEEAHKAAALDSIRGYLSANPLSRAVIDEYNAKVDTVANSAGYKLGSVYCEIDDVFAAIDEAYVSINSYDRDALYATFKQLYAYRYLEYDVTDDAYYAFLAEYAQAMNKVETVIDDSLDTEVISDRESAMNAAYDLLTVAPFSQEAVDIFEQKLTVYVGDFTQNLYNFENVVPKIVDEYTVINGLIEKYKAAEGIEAKMVAFKSLYLRVVNADAIYIKSVDSSYASFVTAYAEVCAEFEAELRAYLAEQAVGTPTQRNAAFGSVADYLSTVKFSQSMVVFYNEKLAEIKALLPAVGTPGYNEKFENINADDLKVVIPPQNFNSNFTDYETSDPLDALLAPYINAITALTSEITALEAKISTSQADIKKLESEIASLKEKVEATELEIAALKTEIEALKTDKATLEAEIAELDTEIEILKDGFSTLEEKIAAVEAEIAALTMQIENLRADTETDNTVAIAAKEAELAEKQALLTQLTEKQELLAGKQTLLAEKQTALGEKETSVSTKEADVEAKKTEITTKEGDIATERAKISSKATEIETIKGQIAEQESLAAPIQAIKSFMFDISDLVGKINTLDAEIEAIKGEVADLENANKVLNEELTALKAQKDEKNNARITEIENLVKENETSVKNKNTTITQKENEISAHKASLVEHYAGASVHLSGLSAAYDFTNPGYEQLIVDFNVAKNITIEEFNRLFDSAKSTDIKVDELRNFRDYINALEASSSSVAVIDAYNATRSVAFEIRKKDAKDCWSKIFPHFTRINTLYKAMVAADADVDPALAAKVEALKFALSEGCIFDYDNLTGEIIPALEVNAIRWVQYFKSNTSLSSSFNDRALSQYIYKELFPILLDRISKIADETAAESEELTKAKEAEAAAIAALQAAMIENSFPTSLVDAFKAKFGVNEEIIPVEYSGATVEGNRGDFANLVGKFYELAAKTASTVNDLQTAFVEIINYVNEAPLSIVNNKADFDERISEIAEQNPNAIVEEQRVLLSSKTPLSEYALGYINDSNNKPINHTFESGSTYPAWSGNSSLVKKNGRSYVRVYEGTSAARYQDVKFPTNTGSIVIEFDVMSEGSLDFVFKAVGNGHSSGAIGLNTTVVEFSNNKLDFGSEHSSAPEKDYTNYQKGVDTPIFAVPGQWMHITCAIDTENGVQELFVDYVSLGTRPLVVQDRTGRIVDTCFYTTFRFNDQQVTEDCCYDNFKIYSGTAYRDMNKAQESEADRFKKYVAYIQDENNSLKDRMYAYREASTLAGGVISKVPSEIMQQFRNFDYANKLYIPAQESYHTYIENQLEFLRSKGVDSSNFASQQAVLNSIETYIELNKDYIDSEAEWFINARAEINSLKASIDRIDNLTSLLAALTLFERATTSTAMQRHYDNAKSYYEACGFEDPIVLANANKDPKTLEFLKNALEQYRNSLDGYYKEYMPACIAEQIKVENSQKIIDCVAIIKTIVPEQEQANLEAIKAAAVKDQETIDFVNTYILVIRAIVDASNYAPGYEGIDDALVIYDLLNDTFYQILMEAHYAVILDQLNKYPLTEAYIARAGICKYIENYIEINSVDMNSETGQRCLYLLEIYKKELEIYYDDFVTVLQANTVAFIETVNKMSSYTGYAELKPLYDEAIEKYYYNMNVDSPEAQAAIAQFEKYEAKLNAIEENSALFVGFAKTLATSTRKAQVYRALVNCGTYVDGVDEGVEGVTDAIKTYENKLAAYNEEIAAVNGDVSNVIDVVCSVRSNSIAATVLAVVKSLFGN